MSLVLVRYYLLPWSKTGYFLDSKAARCKATSTKNAWMFTSRPYAYVTNAQLQGFHYVHVRLQNEAFLFADTGRVP